MKHRNQHSIQATRNLSYQPAYPNAADTNYFARKASEILTAIVSGMGIATLTTFLLIIA